MYQINILNTHIYIYIYIYIYILWTEIEYTNEDISASFFTGDFVC